MKILQHLEQKKKNNDRLAQQSPIMTLSCRVDLGVIGFFSSTGFTSFSCLPCIQWAWSHHYIKTSC